jgi:hypothetical protein
MEKGRKEVKKISKPAQTNQNTESRVQTSEVLLELIQIQNKFTCGSGPDLQG